MHHKDPLALTSVARVIEVVRTVGPASAEMYAVHIFGGSVFANATDTERKRMLYRVRSALSKLRRMHGYQVRLKGRTREFSGVYHVISPDDMPRKAPVGRPPGKRA